MLSECEWLEKNEGIIRSEEICRGCRKPKDKGLPVCWDCFKYRKDTIPLKYFNGSLSQWLEQIEKLKTPEREQ